MINKAVWIVCMLVVSHAQSQELVLLNWDEYLAQDVVQAFTKETGHTIRTVLYDSDRERDDILSTPAIKQFDLVVIDSLSAKKFGQKKQLLRLNPKALPNFNKLGGIWRDSCGDYSSPYFWGTLGIVYRSDKISFKPNSWANLIYPNDTLKGHVGMLLEYYDAFTPALKLAGASLNSENPEEIKAAHKLLQTQKPHVLTYEYAVSYLNESPNKDKLYMAMAYSGDQYALNGEDEEGPWKYVIPKEGTFIWVDCLSVIESSTKKKAALEFIEFINRTDIAILNANEVGSATTHMAAKKMINKELLEDTSLYPGADLIGESEFMKLISTKALNQRKQIISSLERRAKH